MAKFFGQILALILLGALGTWMYSGLDTEPAPPDSVEAPTNDRLTRVEITPVETGTVERTLQVNGETRVNREVIVRAQITGEVEALAVEQGQRVSAGELLVRLDEGDLPDQLRSARATERQREADLNAMSQLVERGLQNRTDQRAAEAALEQAIANRRSIEVQLERTTVNAPFGGVIENLPVSVGSYLSPGADIAVILEYDPLNASAQVPESDISELAIGNPAEVRLITGETFAARISQISSRARASTRSFTVEVEATEEAPDVAGVTAEILFPLDAVQAHFVSPALLNLDQDGNLALKHVDSDNRVVSTPVAMVQSNPSGVWVTGLPDQTRLITVGQGFVQAGETVAPVPANATQSDLSVTD